MNDINEHEKIANDVSNINNQLLNFIEKAKKFNQREALFEQEMTNYEKIK